MGCVRVGSARGRWLALGGCLMAGGRKVGALPGGGWGWPCLEGMALPRMGGPARRGDGCLEGGGVLLREGGPCLEGGCAGWREPPRVGCRVLSSGAWAEFWALTPE